MPGEKDIPVITRGPVTTDGEGNYDAFVQPQRAIFSGKSVTAHYDGAPPGPGLAASNATAEVPQLPRVHQTRNRRKFPNRGVGYITIVC